MIGFEVEINGKKEYRIAARERQAVSIGIKWERSLQVRMPVKENEVSKDNLLYLFIVGLTFPEDIDSKEDEGFCMERVLSVKDRIKIKVIEFKNIDKLEPDTSLLNLSERDIYYKLHSRKPAENKELISNKLEKPFICYSVSLNATNICTAGVGQFGDLKASINWTDKALGNKLFATTKGKIEFCVDGSAFSPNRDKDAYLSWVEQDLVVGDEVSIFILSSIVSDKPKRFVSMSRQRDG